MNASYAKWKVRQLRTVRHHEFATCYTVSVRERTCSSSILKATHHCLWDSLYPIATYFNILLLAQSLRQFEAWPWHMSSCVSQVLYKHRSFYCCLRGFYLKVMAEVLTSGQNWTILSVSYFSELIIHAPNPFWHFPSFSSSPSLPLSFPSARPLPKLLDLCK